MHAGHRHAAVMVKEACAQVHELKSDACQLLLVLNNGYSIYGINSEQNTLLNIIILCRLCNVTFIGHVYFLFIIVISKRINCGLILHKSKCMWNSVKVLRTQKFSSATHNEKCATVTQKLENFWLKFHTKVCVIYTW